MEYFLWFPHFRLTSLVTSHHSVFLIEVNNYISIVIVSLQVLKLGCGKTRLPKASGHGRWQPQHPNPCVQKAEAKCLQVFFMSHALTPGKAWLAHQHLVPQGDENLTWSSSRRDAFLTLQIDQLQGLPNDRNDPELQGRGGMFRHTASLVTSQRLMGAV